MISVLPVVAAMLSFSAWCAPWPATPGAGAGASAQRRVELRQAVQPAQPPEVAVSGSTANSGVFRLGEAERARLRQTLRDHRPPGTPVPR